MIVIGCVLEQIEENIQYVHGVLQRKYPNSMDVLYFFKIQVILVVLDLTSIVEKLVWATSFVRIFWNKII